MDHESLKLGRYILCENRKREEMKKRKKRKNKKRGGGRKQTPQMDPLRGGEEEHP
jgi:hypothetical protein